MDDFSRLALIFQRPESVVALETFNEMIHRPSDTMINTMLQLFGRALQVDPPSNGLHEDPLFIVVLMNRLMTYSGSSTAPSQPSRASLPSTFREILSILLRLQSICPPALFDRINKQLALACSHLAIRILNSYHSNLDPLSEIIQALRQLTGAIENPQFLPSLEATCACLSVFKNVLSFFHHANTVESDSISRKITQTHFESLYEVYKRLVEASLGVIHDRERYEEYVKLGKSMNEVLKVFKMMVGGLSRTNRATILDCFSQTLMGDFQRFMDLELVRLQYWPEELSCGSETTHSFGPHVVQYGYLMLQIQRCTVITPQVLTVYLKIVEHVSNQLVSINGQTTSSEGPEDTSIVQGKSLIKFYPLLNQALKLLNNSLNPWNSYGGDECVTSWEENQVSTQFSESLNREEVHRLAQILQPLLNFQFSLLDPYLDGPTLYDDDDDDDSQDTSDPESSMEIEEDESSQSDWANEADGVIDGTPAEEDFLSSSNPSSPLTTPHVFCKDTTQPLDLTYPAFATSNRRLNVINKEPLQIEIEDLIQNLRLIDQKNY